MSALDVAWSVLKARTQYPGASGFQSTIGEQDGVQYTIDPSVRNMAEKVIPEKRSRLEEVVPLFGTALPHIPPTKGKVGVDNPLYNNFSMEYSPLEGHSYVVQMKDYDRLRRRPGDEMFLGKVTRQPRPSAYPENFQFDQDKYAFGTYSGAQSLPPSQRTPQMMEAPDQFTQS